MATDLLLGFGEDDEEVGAEVRAALAAAGYPVADLAARLGPIGPLRPVGDPVPLALLIVTRRWAASGGLNRAVEELAAAGVRALLIWWDEDAPSDDLSEHAREDDVFYACFLPRSQRAAALVERLRAGDGSDV